MPEAADTTNTVSSAAEARWGSISARSEICAATDAPTAVGAERVNSGKVAFTMGCAPQPRAELPGYDSGVMSIVVVTFLLLSLNFKHYSTFLKTFTEDLWNVGRRRFQGVHTVSETRVLLSLVLLSCVSEGILLFTSIGFTTGLPGALTGCVTIAAAYYVWQILAYNAVGYALAGPDTREQWLKGFNASQSLLGLTLACPALVALFYPGLSATMVSIGILLYIIARIVFICKGFRLFYENLFSLIYFILYFCTLEIAPLLLIYKLFAYFQVQGYI